jgi:hypothetical protein
MHVSLSPRKRAYTPTAVGQIDAFTVRQLAGLAELRDIARAQWLWADIHDTADMPVIIGEPTHIMR